MKSAPVSHRLLPLDARPRPERRGATLNTCVAQMASGLARCNWETATSAWTPGVDLQRNP